jgi:rhodanese-related sulfurtransferase
MKKNSSNVCKWKYFKQTPDYKPMKNRFMVTLAVCMVFGFALNVMATEFPHRSDYPGVPTIDTEVLNKGHESGEFIIVDVRSTIEYNVIHPVDAVHIPVGNVNFVKNVVNLTSKNPGKKIAFYCNGITCLKSYKAAQKALKAGVADCFAYDAGIPEWVTMYPNKTLLLGKLVADPEKQIIPKSDFKKKCVPFEKFKELATSKGSMTIDVRDNIQRTQKLSGLAKVKPIPMDRFIPNFIEKKVHQDKPLLIFDQVGKQVRWLEYYLVENGYKNYYFLAGGATAVLKKQKYKE